MLTGLTISHFSSIDNGGENRYNDYIKGFYRHNVLHHTVKLVGKDEKKMTKVDSKKKQKQESLFNTAFNLFTTKGLSKTSISDIVNEAGVAKGTFYLYFKDKYDIRNKLISHKSQDIFRKAATDLKKVGVKLSFEDKLIFLIDNIINQLNENKSLLTFISKNLSWGIFRDALTAAPAAKNEINFRETYVKMLEEDNIKLKDPEVMLFMLVELVSSTCYSVILYSEPLTLEKFKPYLYDAIHNIIEINTVKE